MSQALTRYLFLYVQQLVLVQQTAAASGTVVEELLDWRLRPTKDLLATPTWNLEVARARIANPAEPDRPMSLLARPLQMDTAQANAFWMAVARRTLAMFYRTNFVVMDYLGKRVQEAADATMEDFGSSMDLESMGSVQGVTQLKTENARDGVGWVKNRMTQQRTLNYPRVSVTGSANRDSLYLLDFDSPDVHAGLFRMVGEFLVIQRPPMRARDETPADPSPLHQVIGSIHAWRGNIGAALVLLQALDLVQPPTTPIPDYDTWNPPAYEGYQRYFDYHAFRQSGGNYFPACFANHPELFNTATISRWQSMMSSLTSSPFQTYNLTMRFYRYVREFYWDRILHRLTQVTSFPQDYFEHLLVMPDYAAQSAIYLPFIEETGPFIPDCMAVPLQHLFSYSFFQLLLKVD